MLDAVYQSAEIGRLAAAGDGRRHGALAGGHLLVGLFQQLRECGGSDQQLANDIRESNENIGARTAGKRRENWWARENSNLQPDRYERGYFVGSPDKI
jgi:hypothetical protein